MLTVAVVQFIELHKSRGDDGENEAQGVIVLGLLKNARELVRVVYTRNDGRHNFDNDAHWTMWANDLEKIIKQTPIDLSFLESIPNQWRRKQIDDGTLQFADERLSVLVDEWSHFGLTRLALENPERRPV